MNEAQRHNDMIAHMKTVVEMDARLTKKECLMLAEAYKNAVADLRGGGTGGPCPPLCFVAIVFYSLIGSLASIQCFAYSMFSPLYVA